MATAIRKFFMVDGAEVEFEPTCFPTWVNIFSEFKKAYPDGKLTCGWVYDDGSTMRMMGDAINPSPVDESLKPVGIDKYTVRDVEEPGDSGSDYDRYLEHKHAEPNGLLDWK